MKTAGSRQVARDSNPWQVTKDRAFFPSFLKRIIRLRERKREREFSLSYECSSFVILSFADGLGWAKIIRRRSNAVIKKVFRRRMGKFLPCSALLVQIIMVEATAVETCREEGWKKPGETLATRNRKSRDRRAEKLAEGKDEARRIRQRFCGSWRRWGHVAYQFHFRAGKKNHWNSARISPD